MADDFAIRAEGLSKCYTLYDRPADRLKQMLMRGRRRYYREFWALRETSLEIAKGEVLGLVGRNGAGKSTLLQLICGTLAPTGGRLEVRGRVAALLELGAGFNPDFSGRENVFLAASIMGLTKAETENRFDEIVEFSGIRGFIDQPVKTYSSGMYVRLAFAVATSVDPDILVIDEALSVGDGEFSRKSFARIMGMKESGKTILFCSHSMYQVEALCNRAVWLEAGRLMLTGKPAEVAAAYTDALKRLEATEDHSQDRRAAPPDRPEAMAGSGRLLEIVALVEGGLAVHEVELCSGVSDLILRFRFVCDPALPTPVLGVALMSEDRKPVTSSSTLNDRVPVSRDAEGYGEICVRYLAIPLLKGRYSVDVWLLDETGLHAYDHAAAAVGLRIVQQGVEQGLVALPHLWTNAP